MARNTHSSRSPLYLRPALRLLGIILFVLVPAVQAGGVTLTFDDIPQGQGLDYYKQYGITIWSPPYYVADHSGSAWGTPNSGTHVLRHDGSMLTQSWFDVIFDTNVYTVSAYVSTRQGRFEIWAQGASGGSIIGKVQFGAVGQPLDNAYVEITSPGTIKALTIWNMAGDMRDFSIDDLTVTFVPEPAGLLVLAAGLVPLLLRRRR